MKSFLSLFNKPEAPSQIFTRSTFADVNSLLHDLFKGKSKEQLAKTIVVFDFDEVLVKTYQMFTLTDESKVYNFYPQYRNIDGAINMTGNDCKFQKDVLNQLKEEVKNHNLTQDQINFITNFEFTDNLMTVSNFIHKDYSEFMGGSKIRSYDRVMHQNETFDVIRCVNYCRSLGVKTLIVSAGGKGEERLKIAESLGLEYTQCIGDKLILDRYDESYTKILIDDVYSNCYNFTNKHPNNLAIHFMPEYNQLVKDVAANYVKVLVDLFHK